MNPDHPLPLDAPEDLAAELGTPGAWLVVLDFDGVLSPIVEHPQDAAATHGVVAAVRRLAGQTDVAIVSGRPIAELDERLGDLPVTVAGGHGAEVRTPDGLATAFVDPAAVGPVLDDLEGDLRSRLDPAAGWQIERKVASLAVHHRRVTDDDRDRHLPHVLTAFEQHAMRPPGFEALSGKAVVELRPAGVDKGRALDWIAERCPGRRPLVLGDDVTDEDAFAAATTRGGLGVLVADTPRDTVARRRLRDPDHVVRFLRAFGDAV